MSDACGASQGRTGRLLRRAGALLVVLATVGLLAFAGYWAASGGRWFVVETPSMGTAAPVGTLLWVEPVDAHRLHVGEFVTFRPPGSSTTYSHRIYRVHSDGTYSTKGQITTPDPWRITAADVVGRVDMRWWGMGWVVKAVPLLLGGGLVLWLAVTRLTAPRWKLPVVVIGTAVLASAVLVVYRPLTRVVLLSLAPGDGGHATFVSTGLLPMRLRTTGGHFADLRTGQVRTVSGSQTDTGALAVHLHPHVSWWFWAVLVTACFVPALWATFVGTRRDGPGRHRAAAVA